MGALNPLLAAVRWRDHLPATDAARPITDDQGTVPEEKAQRRDGAAGLARHGHHLHQLRHPWILHVVAQYLALRCANEHILGAAVQAERGDLARDLGRERLPRFFTSRAPDERLPLDHTL